MVHCFRFYDLIPWDFYSEKFFDSIWVSLSLTCIYHGPEGNRAPACKAVKIVPARWCWQSFSLVTKCNEYNQELKPGLTRLKTEGTLKIYYQIRK